MIEPDRSKMKAQLMNELISLKIKNAKNTGNEVPCRSNVIFEPTQQAKQDVFR